MLTWNTWLLNIITKTDFNIKTLCLKLDLCRMLIKLGTHGCHNLNVQLDHVKARTIKFIYTVSICMTGISGSH